MLAFIEVVVLVAVMLLIYAGFFLKEAGMLPLAGACWTAAASLVIGYLYRVKIRPLALARRAFLAAASRNRFVSLNDATLKSIARQMVRRFPGFDDVYLHVDDLHGLEHEAGLLLMGSYAMSGGGMSFGYFLTGALRPRGRLESFTLSKLRDCANEIDAAGLFALAALPKGASEVLKTCPCDLRFLNNLFIADFDARRLQEASFGDSFDRMIHALAECVAA